MDRDDDQVCLAAIAHMRARGPWVEAHDVQRALDNLETRIKDGISMMEMLETKERQYKMHREDYKRRQGQVMDIGYISGGEDVLDAWRASMERRET